MLVVAPPKSITATPFSRCDSLNTALAAAIAVGIIALSCTCADSATFWTLARYGVRPETTCASISRRVPVIPIGSLMLSCPSSLYECGTTSRISRFAGTLPIVATSSIRARSSWLISWSGAPTATIPSAAVVRIWEPFTLSVAA